MTNHNRMISGDIYFGPDETSVLVVNDFIDMVVLKGNHFGTVDELVSECGRPSSEKNVWEGTIWYYGSKLAVLVKDDWIMEVWIQ